MSQLDNKKDAMVRAADHLSAAMAKLSDAQYELSIIQLKEEQNLLSACQTIIVQIRDSVRLKLGEMSADDRAS